MNPTLPPAFRFLAKRADVAHKTRRNTWLSGLPNGVIERFITNYLQPFIESKGYRLGLSLQDQVRFVRSWAFSHVEATHKSSFLHTPEVTILYCNHYGGEEEFEWYCQTIPTEDWQTFCEQFTWPELLDDSDAGLNQRADLFRLVWNMIDLDNSKQHLYWLDNVYDDDEEEELIQDDNLAFTGSRRTFS